MEPFIHIAAGCAWMHSALTMWCLAQPRHRKAALRRELPPALIRTLPAAGVLFAVMAFKALGREYSGMSLAASLCGVATLCSLPPALLLAYRPRAAAGLFVVGIIAAFVLTLPPFH